MFIHEAVKCAIDTDSFITRMAFAKIIRIKPTNSCKGFIFINSQNTPYSRWQPRAEDIVADDWFVTKEELT